MTHLDHDSSLYKVMEMLHSTLPVITLLIGHRCNACVREFVRGYLPEIWVKRSNTYTAFKCTCICCHSDGTIITVLGFVEDLASVVKLLKENHYENEGQLTAI